MVQTKSLPCTQMKAACGPGPLVLLWVQPCSVHVWTAIMSLEPPGVSVGLRGPDQPGTQTPEAPADSCRPQTLSPSWSRPAGQHVDASLPAPGGPPPCAGPTTRQRRLIPAHSCGPEHLPACFLISGDGPCCYQLSRAGGRRPWEQEKLGSRHGQGQSPPWTQSP